MQIEMEEEEYHNLSALSRSYSAQSPTNPRQIDSPPFPTKLWLTKQSNQLKLYKLLVNEAEEELTKPTSQWKSLFWKTVILQIERGLAEADQKTQEEEEIEGKILTYYISLQQQKYQPPSSTEIYTYYYGNLGDRKSWSRIDLHENKASISQGTTGLRSWGASVCLANYLILNRHLLEEQASVIELGSGTGLLGILAHQLNPSNRLYLTDSNPSVLDRLQLNIALNLNREPQRHNTNIQVIELDWNLSSGSSTLPSPIDLNPSTLVLGADVIYDPDLVPSLVQTIKLCLNQNPNPKINRLDSPGSHDHQSGRSYALICGLVRIPSTWETFLETCRIDGLAVEGVMIDDAIELGRVDRPGIIFPQALDRTLLDLRMVRLTLKLSPK